MDSSVSTSLTTVRGFFPQNSDCHSSVPSSPRSGSLPSPPDSPDSVSSFPSVSSSFFFSSVPASPPYNTSDGLQSLIIPSLSLPEPLKRPTIYGQTLGDIRLIVVRARTSAPEDNFSIQLLLEDNPDIVDIGSWEVTEHGRILRASTDWIDDLEGLDKFIPKRNVEILEVHGYEQTDNAQDKIQSLKSLIQTPFMTLDEILVPGSQSSELIAHLVSSSSSPLYTALIFAVPPFPSAFEQQIMDSLVSEIPIIILPQSSGSHHYRSMRKLSSFRPSSLTALRIGLFRSLDTISALRCESADRFVHWREVEQNVQVIHKRRQRRHASSHEEGSTWNKSNWEFEWESRLSQDVTKRLREDETNSGLFPELHGSLPPYGEGSFDPLHLPSLLMFTLSLLGPLGGCLQRTVVNTMSAVGASRAVVLGAFCAGLGAGILLRS
ncbi:hypothetical protein C8J56DRAFT_926579 [Mycena floridula]|nr:hypothetical protein C8J56DRAFT_926579 [Mycena floridula]